MKAFACSIGLAVVLGLLGCGGGAGGGVSNTANNIGKATSTDFSIHVRDVTGAPIVGAVVTLTSGVRRFEAIADADGTVEILDVPNGDYAMAASAAGFETSGACCVRADGSYQTWALTLGAEGAWAIGSAFILDTHVVERASDGAAITISLDVAVVDGNSQPIETLTSEAFGIVGYDCGWGGSRDCASDAEGRATGSGGTYVVDGDAQAFELRPPSNRHPYVVGVLVERSTTGPDWTARAPALRSFFGALGGNDTASLMSVQQEAGSTSFSVLGPFTSDGGTYFDAIDALSAPAEDGPPIADAVSQAIDRVAAAEGFGLPDVERHVLVLSTQGLSPAQFEAAAGLARSRGVRVGSIQGPWYSASYGLSELAARTGGLVARLDDERQFDLALGALDQVLAGTIPRYRMQFRLAGAQGTFVSGGNVKAILSASVPSPLPNLGVWAGFDTAIP